MWCDRWYKHPSHCLPDFWRLLSRPSPIVCFERAQGKFATTSCPISPVDFTPNSSPLISHPSPVTRHLSPLISHPSSLNPHLSPLTPHLSHFGETMPSTCSLHKPYTECKTQFSRRKSVKSMNLRYLAVVVKLLIKNNSGKYLQYKFILVLPGST